MSKLPLPDDPLMAVVIERLEALKKGFDDHRSVMKADVADLRKEMKDDIGSLRNEVAGVKEEQAAVRSFFTTAKGGYIVLVGLGAMLMWALGAWDKVAKLWQ